MKTFADTLGRKWTISINLGTAKRLRDKLQVDLLQPELGDPPLMTRLGTDEILLGEVLCELLADQFEANGSDADDILAAFDGQTLLAAQEAFYEDLVDFFRGRGRLDRARAIGKQNEMIAAAILRVDRKIGEIDIEKAIDGAMSGALPAPSALTPAS